MTTRLSKLNPTLWTNFRTYTSGPTNFKNAEVDFYNGLTITAVPQYTRSGAIIVGDEVSRTAIEWNGDIGILSDADARHRPGPAMLAQRWGALWLDTITQEEPEAPPTHPSNEEIERAKTELGLVDEVRALIFDSDWPTLRRFAKVLDATEEIRKGHLKTLNHLDYDPECSPFDLGPDCNDNDFDFTTKGTKS